MIEIHSPSLINPPLSSPTLNHLFSSLLFDHFLSLNGVMGRDDPKRRNEGPSLLLSFKMGWMVDGCLVFIEGRG